MVDVKCKLLCYMALSRVLYWTTLWLVQNVTDYTTCCSVGAVMDHTVVGVKCNLQCYLALSRVLYCTTMWLV
jgi:hypothetical protein